MSAFEIYLSNFQERYAELLAKQDSENLHLLLKEAIPIYQSDENRLAAGLHQQKARAFALFAENREMDRHFEAAINLIEPNEAWKLYLDWANLYFLQLRIVHRTESTAQIFAKASILIQRVDIKSLKKDRFALWAVRSFQAFCELALAENKNIPKLFSELDFSPISLSLINNPSKIREFYAHFFKAIAIAIEQRDAHLLMKLLKMISVDDELLMGNADLLTKFQQTLNDAMDLRPEFAAEFNFIYAIAPLLNEHFPNLALFIALLEKQNFGGLHYFFKAIS
ncbi:MAG TPA: hypothetical protein DCG69_13035 [Bacteroidales bacterium]|nr:hypothetical protein [Bacteroidales bacterium]